MHVLIVHTYYVTRLNAKYELKTLIILHITISSNDEFKVITFIY